MSDEPLFDPIEVRLPQDVLAALERIATILDRPPNWVIVRAMRAYIEGEGTEVLRVAAGIEQLDKGEAEDLDDVIAQLEQIVR